MFFCVRACVRSLNRRVFAPVNRFSVTLWPKYGKTSHPEESSKKREKTNRYASKNAYLS